MNIAALLRRLSPRSFDSAQDDRPQRKRSALWNVATAPLRSSWAAFKATQANTVPGVLMGWNRGVQPKLVRQRIFGAKPQGSNSPVAPKRSLLSSAATMPFRSAWKGFKATQANTVPGVLMGWNRGVQPKNVARAYFGPQRMLYDGAKIGMAGSSLGQMLFPGALNRSVSDSGAANMMREGTAPLRSAGGWAAGLMGFGGAGPNRGLNDQANPAGPPQPRRSWAGFAASWLPSSAAKDSARSVAAAGSSGLKAAGALARFKPAEAKKHMGEFVRHLIEANRALESHSRHRVEENRQLAAFSAEIAFSIASLEIGRLRRKIEMGRETSDSARYASAARNRYEDSTKGWEQLKAWAGNYFAGFGDDIRATINNAAAAIVEALVPDVLDGGGVKAPDGQMPANVAFLIDTLRQAAASARSRPPLDGGGR